MFKKTLIALAAAATLVGSAPAFASKFHLVVPLSSRSAPSNEAISVVLSPSTLPMAVAAAPYSHSLVQHLQITGDPAVKPNKTAWAVSGGALPPGLTLSAGGIVQGTPTAADASGSSFDVLATYKGQAGAQSYTIKVLPQANITLASATLPGGYLGQGYTFDIKSIAAVTGGTGALANATFSVEAGTLPEGLTLSTGGVLAGTPTAVTALAGENLTINGSYQGASAQRTYNLKIVELEQIALAAGNLPGATEGVPYTFDFKSLASVTAGPGIANATFGVAAGALPTGLTLGTNGILTGTPTAGTGAAGVDFSVKTDYATASAQTAYNLKIAGATVALDASGPTYVHG